MRQNTKSVTRTLFFITLLSFLTVAISPSTIAEPLKPVPGEFTVVLQGFDPATSEFIFEGYKTGELSGFLTTRVSLTRETGAAMHLATRWTLITDWDDTIEGENTSILNPASLRFREHGIIVEATGDLEERIGNFVVIHGEVSDVNFIPGVTQATAHVKYVPSKGLDIE